jgi:hypothetical protein
VSAVSTMLAWPSMSWIALRSAPEASARGRSAVAEVVQPDRRETEAGDQPGETVGQVAGTVGPAIGTGEDETCWPIDPELAALPFLMRPQHHDGGPVQRDRTQAGDALGRQQYRLPGVLLQLLADGGLAAVQVDLRPGQAGGLTTTQAAQRDQVVAGVQRVAGDTAQELRGLRCRPDRHRGTLPGGPPGGDSGVRPDDRVRPPGAAPTGPGLSAINCSRTAAFRAERSVARIRTRVAAEIGCAVLPLDRREHRLQVRGRQGAQRDPSQVRQQVEADVPAVAAHTGRPQAVLARQPAGEPPTHRPSRCRSRPAAGCRELRQGTARGRLSGIPAAARPAPLPIGVGTQLDAEVPAAVGRLRQTRAVHAEPAASVPCSGSRICGTCDP